MALSRSFLSALGIEGEKIEEIVKANYESLAGLKEERDQLKIEVEGLKKSLASFKDDAGKVEGLQKELDELKQEAEKNNSDSWKVKYEAIKEERDKLKGEFDEFKTATAAEKTKNAKEKAYRALLKEQGIPEKRLDTILKVSDIEKLELDDEGKFKNAEELATSIKDEWADFIPKESEKGAETATPPAKTGGSAITKDEIMAISDREERQKAIAENPKLFGLE